MSRPYERILCVDFETFFDMQEYTLRKMTTEEYIRDPRFYAHGACVHEVGSAVPVLWVRHDDLPGYFESVDWSCTAVLGHNAMFDVGILSMVYGVEPCFIFDTLSMARALRGSEGGNSLAQLAKDYGLPNKGSALALANGMERLDPSTEQQIAEYCAHDVVLCEQIFGKLLMRVSPDGTTEGPYPTKELRLIDMTLRMFTEPMFELDRAMLEQALVEENDKLSAALAKVQVEPSQLSSNDMFADVLRSIGVEPPQKVSKTTGKLTYAFAKSDALFQALLNGDNEEAALLCTARLKVKSTLERTRAQRFIDISKRGACPVPLHYYGAGTGRYAATGSINMQNMKRGSFLRKSIMAPKGYVICAGDLSQIEPRVLAWLSDYDDMLNIFRAGGDPYATFGATMFSIPGLTKESHPLLRQSAKSALLGAGYQLGWASFAAQLLVGFLGAPPQRYTKADAKQLGVTARHVQEFISNGENLKKMDKIARTCTDEELLIHCLAAKAIIDKYRAAAWPVGGYWELLGNLIEHSLVGGEEYNHKGVLTFRKGEIELVNGMKMYYRDIKAEKDERGRLQYSYSTGKMRKKLYAGLLANNTTQGLARVVMTDGLLRAQKRFPVKGTVHDEGLFLVPEAGAAEGAAWVKEQMIMVPKYMPGIPLNADVGFHKRYGLAKG
jgi:DNA polymerase I-like protein with 3'-5' exonuclease and polymerase domains